MAAAQLKKVCIICEKEFDLTELFLHLQEENLKQLLKLHIALQDIKEVLELTYQYMDEEDELNLKTKEVAEENKRAAASVDNVSVNVKDVTKPKTLPMQHSEFSALMTAVQDKVKNSLKE
jgi:hypothetical protein